MPEARLAKTRAAYQLDTERREKLANDAPLSAKLNPRCQCVLGFVCVYCLTAYHDPRLAKVSA